MPRDFLGKRLLVITAHPDDESVLAAGTLYKNREQGGQNILLCASFGEKGDAFLKQPIKEARLRALRKKEMERAARFLGVRKLVVLNLPDTNIRAHKQKVLARSLALAKRFKPDAILGFGSYGFSGHRDHIAVGEVARRLSRMLRLPLYTFTVSVRAARMSVERLENRARSPMYTNRKPVFEKPSVAIAINKTIKLKALKLHTSQFGGKPPFHQLPAALRNERLTREYFHASQEITMNKSIMPYLLNYHSHVVYQEKAFKFPTGHAANDYRV